MKKSLSDNAAPLRCDSQHSSIQASLASIPLFTSIPVATEPQPYSRWWLSALLKGLSMAVVEQLKSLCSFVRHCIWGCSWLYVNGPLSPLASKHYPISHTVINWINQQRAMISWKRLSWDKVRNHDTRRPWDAFEYCCYNLFTNVWWIQFSLAWQHLHAKVGFIYLCLTRWS